MNKDIRHTFRIGASPDAIADALMQKKHLQRWWTKEAHVQRSKGILGWNGHGFEIELDMAYDRARRTVVWQCTRSNMQNTNACEGTKITFVLPSQGTETRFDFSKQAIGNRRVMKHAIRDGRSLWAQA